MKGVGKLLRKAVPSNKKRDSKALSSQFSHSFEDSLSRIEPKPSSPNLSQPSAETASLDTDDAGIDWAQWDDQSALRTADTNGSAAQQDNRRPSSAASTSTVATADAVLGNDPDSHSQANDNDNSAGFRGDSQASERATSFHDNIEQNDNTPTPIATVDPDDRKELQPQNDPSGDDSRSSVDSERNHNSNHNSNSNLDDASNHRTTDQQQFHETDTNRSKPKKKKKKKKKALAADDVDVSVSPLDDGNGTVVSTATKKSKKKKKKSKKPKADSNDDDVVVTDNEATDVEDELVRKPKNRRSKIAKASSVHDVNSLAAKLERKAAKYTARHSNANSLQQHSSHDDSNSVKTAPTRRRRHRDSRKKKRSSSMQPSSSPSSSPKPSQDKQPTSNRNSPTRRRPLSVDPRPRSRSNIHTHDEHDAVPKKPQSLRMKFGEFVARSRSRSRSITRKIRHSSKSVERKKDKNLASVNTSVEHVVESRAPRRSKKTGSTNSSSVSTDSHSSPVKVETVTEDAINALDGLRSPTQQALRDVPAPLAIEPVSPTRKTKKKKPAVASTKSTTTPEAEVEAESGSETEPVLPKQLPSEPVQEPKQPEPMAANGSRLQEQLSEALEKVVRSTEETIAVKDELLHTSQTLAKAQGEIFQVSRDRDDWKSKAQQMEDSIRKQNDKITELKHTIDDQLDQLERSDRKLELADEEIRELEDELRKVEDELVQLKVHNKRILDSTGSTATTDDDSGNSLLMTYEEQEAAQQRILDLEREVENLRGEVQRIKEVGEENTMLQGQLKGRDLEWNAKLNRKDEVIATLQQDMQRLTRKLDEVEKGSYTSLTKQLKEKQSQLEAAQNQAAQAQKTIEQLTAQCQELQSTNDMLEDQLKIQASKTKEWQDKNAALHDKLTSWTEKTFVWKQRAAAAEHKLEMANNPVSEDDDLSSTEDATGNTKLGSSNHGNSGSSNDPSPQALFLQAAMDRKSTNNNTNNQNASNNRRLFGLGWGGDRDAASKGDMQAMELQQLNADLQEQVNKLQSEMIKMQSKHKEEMYLRDRRIEELEDQNCEFAAKNAALLTQALAVDEAR